MTRQAATITALLFSVFVCSSCREAIDDITLESSTTVRKNWSDLVPGAGRTGVYTFVRFNISSAINLMDVWHGLTLQVKCALTGATVDQDLESVTFGPFFEGQNIVSLRVDRPSEFSISPGESGRYEYVVYALPNFEVGKLIDHRLVSQSIFETEFDGLSCYLRGAGTWPQSIPKSAVWSVSWRDLLALHDGN